MTKDPNKCENCKERDVELEEVEIAGEKKMWCCDCVKGREIENELKC